jgi:hypothetical protein
MNRLQRLADRWAASREWVRKQWSWLGWVLTLAAVLYGVVVVVVGGLGVRSLDWAAFVPAAFASLGLYLVSLLAQFFVWTRMLRFHRPPDWKDVEIYSRMILTRQLPGGVWHWIGRAAMYTAATRLPTRLVVTANFLEWGMIILTGVGLYVLGIASTVLLWPILGALAIWSVAAGLAFAWQPAARAWPARLLEGGLWIGLYALSWFSGGAILHLFVRVAGGATESWFATTHLWTLTGSIGLSLSLIPAVFGIQEITLTVILQGLLAPAPAFVVAVLMRFVFSLAEVGWGMVGWGLSALVQRRLAQRVETPLRPVDREVS